MMLLASNSPDTVFELVLFSHSLSGEGSTAVRQVRKEQEGASLQHKHYE